MSVLIHGPCRPKVYEIRPTRNGSVLPVVLLAEEVEMPLSASTYERYKRLHVRQ